MLSSAAAESSRGLILFRLLGCGGGFILCGQGLLSILLGYSDDDPTPWLIGLSFHGLPTVLAWLLRVLSCIDAAGELTILQWAYVGCIVVNSTRVALFPMVLDDLWKQADFSALVFMVWGCTLRHLEDQTDSGNQGQSPTSHSSSSRLLLWPLVLSAISAVLRLCWDEQMAGDLCRTWVICLFFLFVLQMMTDHHHTVVREAQSFVMQRKVQESLLSSAFDATVCISNTLFVSRSSDSFDQLMGQSMQSKSLRGNWSLESIAQLEELMRIADETGSDGVSSRMPLCRALVTCYNHKDMEFDCELCAVIQAPAKKGGKPELLCGLRLAGEMRPSERSGQDPGSAENTHSVAAPSHPPVEQRLVDPVKALWSLFQGVQHAVWSTIVTDHDDDDEGKSLPTPGRRQAAPSEKPQVSVNLSRVVWETLLQLPGACAVMCTREDLKIRNMTSAAADTLPCQVGDHISSALVSARHSVFLRKVMDVAETKVRSNVQAFGSFYAHPAVKLPLRAAGSATETQVRLLLVSGEGSAWGQPLVILVLAPSSLPIPSEGSRDSFSWVSPASGPNGAAGKTRAAPAFFAESDAASTLMPDDSASQLHSEGGRTETLRRMRQACLPGS
mmetsp:Transcript_25739/g.60074  ORF Transcript_25739/g.60074 Transcript_25739/m.60074 type:complete len:615 (-) Transcript_25739:170-2014(-)